MSAGKATKCISRGTCPLFYAHLARKRLTAPAAILLLRECTFVAFLSEGDGNDFPPNGGSHGVWHFPERDGGPQNSVRQFHEGSFFYQGSTGVEICGFLLKQNVIPGAQVNGPAEMWAHKWTRGSPPSRTEFHSGKFTWGRGPDCLPSAPVSFVN